MNTLNKDITQPLMAPKVDIKGLHILKFLSIIMVVGLHTRMPFDHYLLVQYCRVGVPIFFMISGYFTIREDAAKTAKGLKKSILKIAKLALIANAVYLSWYLFWDGIAGLITWDYIVDKAAEFVENFLLWGDRYGGHLWYLTSFLQVLVIYWVFCKLKIEKWLWITVPVGLALNFINGRYCGIIFGLDYEPGFYDSRNVFTVGMPFFIIGGWLKNRRFGFIAGWKGYGLLAALSAVQYVEYMWLCKFGISPTMGDVNITTIPLAILLFCMGREWTVADGVADTLARWGSDYTMHIYTWHLLFFFIYRTLTSYVPVTEQIPSFVFVYGCAFVLAILLCNKELIRPDKWVNFRKFTFSK